MDLQETKMNTEEILKQFDEQFVAKRIEPRDAKKARFVRCEAEKIEAFIAKTREEAVEAYKKSTREKIEAYENTRSNDDALDTIKDILALLYSSCEGYS